MRHIRLAALLIFCLAMAGVALAGKIAHKLVALGVQEEMLLLDLVEEYQLDANMLEALDNGVPLTFETRFWMRDDDRYLWQSAKVDLVLRRTLSYQPLDAQYEVWRQDTGTRAKFATLDAALRALGDFRSQPIIATSALRAGRQYNIEISTELVIAELPLPMRPKAYLSPSWYLSSPVYQWRLNP